MRLCPLTDVQVSKPLYLLAASRGDALPRPLPPLLLALLMRWRLIPQHSPCRSSSRLWWSQHDVGYVATADSSEIGNSVPACTRAALQATHIPHANRRVRAITLARMAVACEQAENAARGSCGAQKQRVYKRYKRNVTGMPNVNSGIKRNFKQCLGKSCRPRSHCRWRGRREEPSLIRNAACATACVRRR